MGPAKMKSDNETEKSGKWRRISLSVMASKEKSMERSGHEMKPWGPSFSSGLPSRGVATPWSSGLIT